MPMTKGQIAAHLADEVGITKKQSAAYLDSLAALAYKEAKQTFTLPGLGKLVLQAKAARTGIMPFGPKKGEKYKIPARKVVRFRVAKAAKDAILKLKK